MPYPNSNILNIVIPQTSASLQSGQAPFVERIISGSNLILQTDSTGTLIGSSDLNMSNITASNITASGYISASNLYVKTNITDVGTLTVLGASTFGGLVSASAGLTASAIQDAGTLNVIGATTLAGLTGTTATFSGLVSASAGLTASAIQDAGTLTVVGATTLAGLTGTTATFSGLVSASAGLTASAIQDAGTLTVIGATTLAGLTGTTATFSGLVSASAGLTASAIQDAGTLTVVGNSTLTNVFATNITASNISASGNISASALRVETSIVDGGTLTVIGNTVLGDTISDTIQITGSTSLSGSFSVVGNSTLANLTASNISASGNISASNEYLSGNLTVIGTTTLGNLSITNLTASNISASNTLSASNVWFGNSMTYVETMATGSLTTPDITFTSTATTGSDVMFSISTTTLTGSAVALAINASGSQASYAISASNGIIAGTDFVLSNITASGVLSASRIVASEITASSELFVGTGPAYRTYGEAAINENLARLYVSGSATIFSKYATLNLATSASDAGAQSSILFSRLASSGSETVFQPRMQLGTESGSNDLRLYAYYVSNDPDNTAQGSGSNIVAGTRAIFKQSGYFGIGSFISYGSAGGAKTTYVSSLPGYTGVAGPDAMLTILPMDSGSTGTATSKVFNRNILNIMSYDTSSIMFISGSDGYVLLGKNTTDGINRLQVAGNISASAYTGSSANFTSITANNISASGYISASTLIVTGNTSLANLSISNLTASNITASGYISASSIDVANNVTVNGDLAVNGGDITTTAATANIFNANATIVNIGGGATNTVLLGNATGVVKTAGDLVLGINNAIKDTSGLLGLTVSSSLTTVAGDLRVGGNDIQDSTGVNNLTLSSTKVNVPLTAQSTDWTTGALVVAGGVGIGKNLYVSGSTFLYGDLTIYGSSSIVNISSSNVIIGDNRVVLNALVPFQRYSGIDVYDSGSANATSSLLWDGQTDNWITVDQNQSASNMIIGPTSSLGSVPSLTVNRLTKAYDVNGIIDSAVSDDGTTLRYTGNVISASSITASYGTVTYITGALVTYVTGSFNILQVSTGSNPGTGQVPLQPTSSGFVGQITVDNNFIYVYTGNIWKRVPISNWSA